MPEARREVVLKDLVTDIAKGRQLPNISDYNTNVPNCIRDRLERLYRGLAAIDYSKRISNFNEIFRELSTCETILAKEKEYIRMINLRKLWFENRARNKAKSS